jgi:hypothetical protein
MDYLNGSASRALPEDDYNAQVSDLTDRIEAAMKAEPVTGHRDLAMKVVVLSGEGSWGLPNETTRECARIAGRSFDKMPRCLFEDEGALVAGVALPMAAASLAVTTPILRLFRRVAGIGGPPRRPRHDQRGVR